MLSPPWKVTNGVTLHKGTKSMRRNLRLSLASILAAAIVFVGIPTKGQEAARSASSLYTKTEHLIPMRDGVKLFTAVYRPKDNSRTYPILMNRTPYSCRPYGADSYPPVIGPSRGMMEEGYIIVYQDVRGRYMSEGVYDNMRPHIPGDMGIDESSDAYDTLEWLLNNVDGHNGKVGMWGISYPGFYSAAALPEAHPALKAVSPQAPIADFFFDDFHHHGAYTLAYFLITPVFGYQKTEQTQESWYSMVDPGTRDGYKFLLSLGALRNASRYYKEDNFFWKELVDHPNYDTFWQQRNLLPHLRNLHTAVLTVGGFFDAEDLYGPLQIYKTIERENPGLDNRIVMGPWGHGDWARRGGIQSVGDIIFGTGIGSYYQDEVEARFFRQHLKSAEDPLALPEALMFDTGRRRWQEFDRWPPAGATNPSIYLGDGGSLTLVAPGVNDQESFTEYVSDPSRPVPDNAKISIGLTPRDYMTADQRHATRRPDVATFVTEPLAQDFTLAGEIVATLWVSTSGTDSDWVVKLIDVYPSSPPPGEALPGVPLGDYEQLVRGEILRGRFRRSYEISEPFVPGQATPIKFPLQDVFHTFRAGHRIQVQVQSTWFPVFDRNPQNFVPNIFKARDEDFVKATQRIYHTAEYPSRIEIQTIENNAFTTQPRVP